MDLVPVSLAAPVVTLALAKEHLKVDYSAEDATITRILGLARDYLMAETGRLIGDQTIDCYIDDFYKHENRQVDVRLSAPVGRNQNFWGPRFDYQDPFDDPRTIRFDLSPLSEVIEVKYFDTNEVEQTLDPASYVVTKGAKKKLFLRRAFSWPSVASIPQAVRIRVRGGYIVGANLSAGEIELPADLYDAHFLLINHFYEYREQVHTGLNLSEFPKELTVQRICAHYGVVNV